MAATLGVNRKTVQLAYDELVAQGWLTTQNRRGTFVSANVESTLPPPGGKATHDRCGEKIGGKLIPPSPPKEMVVFDDGAPDTRLVPVATLARAYRGALMKLSRSNRLADEHPLGSPALRQAIATMLNFDRGLPVSPERICLTRGSQMAIFLVAALLSGPGTAVAVEDPGYPQAREAFRVAGAEVIPIPVDEHGLVTEALERVCLQRPLRCLYVTPHHQYPTTAVMPPERRRHLLDLSDRFNFIIVEDDYDHEFHFTRNPILPLASQNPDGNIIYIGSFSKIITPSLRSGYMVVPRRLLRRFAFGIARVDRQGDPAMEAAIAELIDEGEVRRHFNKALQVYVERRRSFAAILERQLGPWVEFSVPEGGLAYWVRFRTPLAPAAFTARTRAAGVRILPGRLFTGQRAPLLATRLGYAGGTVAESEEGLRRLRRALD